MGARILYTVRIYEKGFWDVEQHQRSLDPMKDVVIDTTRHFHGKQIRLAVTTFQGGKLILNDPPKKGETTTMRRIAAPKLLKNDRALSRSSDFKQERNS